MRAVLSSVAAVALVAAVACERDNAAYCDVSRGCAAGLQCNLTTNACEPMMNDLGVDFAGGDSTSGDGSQSCPNACTGVTPICAGAMCLGCNAVGDGESACANLSSSTPHCLTSGSMAGECVECRTSSDCTQGSATVCDPATHQCRGCVTDSDCPSLVCDLTPGSTTRNSCLPPSSVIYVDKANCNDGNSGASPQQAVCKISTGISKAKAANATTVHIANPPNDSYNQENLSLMNVNVTLVGETGATVKPSGNNNPAIVIGGASNVVLRNLAFTGGAGMSMMEASPGIYCNTPPGATLVVVGCRIYGNVGLGVDANNCSSLWLDSSTVGGALGANQGGGVRVGGAFHVIDNFIVDNGSTNGGAMGSSGGVVINSTAASSPRDFINNTVANNQGTGMMNIGVSCPGGVITLVNDILFKNNNGASVSETDCMTSYCASDDTRDLHSNNNVDVSSTPPGFVSTTDYHLQASSPCVNAGTSTGAPSYDVDGQLRPDPTSGKVDIGADEVE